MNGPTRGERDRKIPIPVLVPLAMIFGALLMLVAIRWLFPAATTVEIGFPEGQLSVRVEQPGLDHRVLLDTLFREAWSRDAVIGWLKRHESVFHIDDVELSKRMTELVPNLPRDRVQNLDTLNRLIEKHPAIADLREKAHAYEAPFQFIGTPIAFGVPSEQDRPKQYFVHARIGSEWAGKRVEFFHPYSQRRLILYALSKIEPTATVDFHLNAAQAGHLLGQGLIVESKNEVYAYQLDPKGDVLDPTGPLGSRVPAASLLGN